MVYIIKQSFVSPQLNKQGIENPGPLNIFWSQKRWQGPPNVNKVNQHEIVLSFKVSLFIQFMLSWKQTVLFGHESQSWFVSSDYNLFPKFTQCIFKLTRNPQSQLGDRGEQGDCVFYQENLPDLTLICATRWLWETNNVYEKVQFIQPANGIFTFRGSYSNFLPFFAFDCTGFHCMWKSYCPCWCCVSVSLYVFLLTARRTNTYLTSVFN